MPAMESFYVSISGAVFLISVSTYGFIVLRKDIQNVTADLEGDILRVEDRGHPDGRPLAGRGRRHEGSQIPAADKRRASRRSCADRDPLRPG